MTNAGYQCGRGLKVWRGALAAALLLIAAATEGRAAERERIGVITAEAGELTRHEQPVSVALPESVDAEGSLRLVELREDGEREVASQVEPGRGDEPARLWFFLDGRTEAGAERRFALSYGLPERREGIELLVADGAVAMRRGGRTMFRYNHTRVQPPAGVDEVYARSGYIHPVYSPSGLMVTEDFPEDHLHHKGVWFPWTRTRFEGREIDFWNLGGGTGTVRFAGFETLTTGPVFGHLVARQEHVDLTQGTGKIALNESWDVRAWNAGGPDRGWWAWDLTATQTPATDSPLELLEYHYGGLGFRGAKAWVDDNHEILTSEGHTKADGHGERARWAAHSGEVEAGRKATVVILVHPENARFPEPMRIWESGGAFFCFSPVQLGDWTLEPGSNYRFRYRFFIHEGPIDADLAEHVWRQFAEPVIATLELE